KDAAGRSGSNQPFPVPLPEFLTGKDLKGRPGGLTWDELTPRLAELDEDRKRLEEKREDTQFTASNVPDPKTRNVLLEQDRHYKAQLEQLARLTRNVEAEYWMRPALAGGCLVFALIGCPVGIWANRSDYLSTFVVCWMPTVF